MVCDRCRFAVRDILDVMGISHVAVHLGEVDLGDQVVDEEQLDEFRHRIEDVGFELISDRKSRLIEGIKSHIIALLQEEPGPEKVTLSTYLSDRLHHDYRHLSSLFSSVEGVTIEQYFINQRAEKVKELLVYDELSLTEIAYQLGFSSVSHLSGQFRKVTGQTPSQFKKLRDARQRNPLDKT
jgi:AraC-like DNA-binding protein